MGYFYKIYPCKIYESEVPENFQVPSMYFPPPFSFDGNDTNMTFAKTYNLSIKLFAKDAHTANDAAELIADNIRSKRKVIPLINHDGTFANDYLRIDRIETRISDGFALIIVNWTSRYFYKRETWPSIKDVSFNNKLKEE